MYVSICGTPCGDCQEGARMVPTGLNPISICIYICVCVCADYLSYVLHSGSPGRFQYLSKSH